MKVAMRIAVALLLAAGVAGAQTPAPAATPEQGPPPGGGFGMQSPAPGALQAKMRRGPGPGVMAEMRPDLGAWWKNSDIVQEIGLSQQQVKQIEDTFYDHRLKLIDLKANVEREETRLQPLMEADTVNEAQIGPQIDKVLAARTALEKANVMMMLSIRKVLTVDQWKKLESLRNQREGMMKRKIEEGERMKRRMGPGYTPAPPPPEEPDFDPYRP